MHDIRELDDPSGAFGVIAHHDIARLYLDSVFEDGLKAVGVIHRPENQTWSDEVPAHGLRRAQ